LFNLPKFYYNNARGAMFISYLVAGILYIDYILNVAVAEFYLSIVIYT
jgi:hypothetical protein